MLRVLKRKDRRQTGVCMLMRPSPTVNMWPMMQMRKMRQTGRRAYTALMLAKLGQQTDPISSSTKGSV